MQSIDDLARAIADLNSSDRQALLEKVGKLNIENGRDNGVDLKFQAMQEVMSDQLFLADLCEVMEEFRSVDDEETPA